MENWKKLDNDLKRYVNPPTHPVAVSFLDDEASLPSRAKRPLRDLRVTMAPCQGAAMARRYGWSVAFKREDVGCAIAAHTYGWEQAEDKDGAIYFLTEMNYAADRKAAELIYLNFRTLGAGRNPTVLFSPLKHIEIEPTVVLLYVNSAQLMRLVHGATYATGTPLQCSFSGRAASCTEGIIGALLDGAPKIVVPGNGDRVWASCQDHEMVMAVPAHRLDALAKGLEMTHRSGIRYPIPTYLRYTPEVGLTIPLSDIFKPQELDKLIKKRTQS
jgi:uncharacterized protein (DUF169 family)